MRGRVLLLCAALVAGPVAAQDAATLADMRQDLSILSGELQRLQQELNTTGQGGVTVSGSTLDRVNAIEAELQRLTSRAEELGHRIDTVVTDGTNRIGDLEFRICELEEGCDIGSLGQTPPLGGEAPDTGGAAPAPAPAPVEEGSSGSDLPSGGAQLAVAEETDFRAAQEALNTSAYQEAVQKFGSFRETYPGSPLEPAALLGEGKALDATGDTREAARRFLDTYATYPESSSAPEALWRLGAALGELGSVSEACVTLAEVSARYPDTPAVSEAAAERDRLGCE
ncbi:tol-pal system protein YbgF [Salipiger mucosus]|uniref:tol-pal system protein YbgF n=1 Tax=Salipiger mucosus TaxID=263378 RepID=UPI00039D840E|nr:tol-pal system protein YbgF [Salipiger mucosus]